MANEIAGSNSAVMSRSAVVERQSAGAAVIIKEQSRVDRQALPEDGKALPQAKTSSELTKAVTDINRFVQNVQRDLHFSMDAGSGRSVIKVIDSKTDTVIRQIPSEEVLALAAHLKEVSDGMLDDSSGGLLFRADA